jgi:hypothetical protein
MLFLIRINIPGLFLIPRSRLINRDLKNFNFIIIHTSINKNCRCAGYDCFYINYRCARTCKKLQRIACDESLWKRIDLGKICLQMKVQAVLVIDRLTPRMFQTNPSVAKQELLVL